MTRGPLSFRVAMSVSVLFSVVAVAVFAVAMPAVAVLAALILGVLCMLAMTMLMPVAVLLTVLAVALFRRHGITVWLQCRVSRFVKQVRAKMLDQQI